MEIRFWGTRGSIPVPGPDTVRYGGNTTCVEIRHGDDYIIVDSGTGIRSCGNLLLRERGGNLDIPLLITHTHWDHIQGLPFFAPAFIPGNRIRIYGPHNHESSFDRVLAGQMQYSYFPVNFSQLKADISPRTLRDLVSFQIGGITVSPKYVNHPIPTLAYRFEADGQSIVFMTDVEPYRDIIYNGVCPDEGEREDFEEVQRAVADQNQALIDFAESADIFIIDAQYTKEEYERQHIGWGHAAMEAAISFARKARARELVFFHHDPERSDDELDRLVGFYGDELGREKGCSISQLRAAAEGAIFKV